MTIKKMQFPKKTAPQRGFTLIELSIVLVIIGFIAGGIYSGSYLLSVSKMKKVMSFYSETQSAINTFRVKYGDKPGEMNPADAALFNFTTCSGGDVRWNPRRDGIIKAFNPDTVDPGTYFQSSAWLQGESILFWKHLTAAGLLNSSVDASAPIYNGYCKPDVTLSNKEVLAKYIPKSPIDGGFYHLANVFASNDYRIVGINISAFGYPPQANSTGAILTFNQVVYLDTKMDDGRPQAKHSAAEEAAGLKQKGIFYTYGNRPGDDPRDITASKSASQCGGVSFDPTDAAFEDDGIPSHCEINMGMKELNF